MLFLCWDKCYVYFVHLLLLKFWASFHLNIVFEQEDNSLKLPKHLISLANKNNHLILNNIKVVIINIQYVLNICILPVSQMHSYIQQLQLLVFCAV